MPFPTAIEKGHKKLYHYQRYNPEHLADLLIRKRIHCATPGKLNDPWDCRPWFNTSSLLEDQRQLEAYLDRRYSSSTVHVPERIRQLHDNEVRSNPDALKEEVASLSRSLQQEIARRGIYCLTPLPDNILMWSHYADNHKGVCLEFDTSVSLFASARAVDYKRDYPVQPPFHLNPDLVLGSVLTKSDVWSYEQEFRILGLPHDNYGKDIALDGQYLPIGDALTGVVLGCEAGVEKIRKFFKGHAPNIPLYQAGRSNEQYRLTIIPLPVGGQPRPKDSDVTNETLRIIGGGKMKKIL